MRDISVVFPQAVQLEYGVTLILVLKYCLGLEKWLSGLGVLAAPTEEAGLIASTHMALVGHSGPRVSITFFCRHCMHMVHKTHAGNTHTHKRFLNLTSLQAFTLQHCHTELGANGIV